MLEEKAAVTRDESSKRFVDIDLDQIRSFGPKPIFVTEAEKRESDEADEHNDELFHKLMRNMLAEHDKTVGRLKLEIDRLEVKLQPKEQSPQVSDRLEVQLHPNEQSPQDSNRQVTPRDQNRQVTSKTEASTAQKDDDGDTESANWESRVTVTGLPHGKHLSGGMYGSSVSEASLTGPKIAFTQKSRFQDTSTVSELVQLGLSRIMAYMDYSDEIRVKIHRTAEWFINVSDGEPDRKGRLAKFTDGNLFTSLCFIVIMANAVYIIYVSDREMTHSLGYFTSSEYRDNPQTQTMVACELSFSVFYIVELTLKLFVHRFYFFINSEYRWNIMDTILVGLAMLDVSLMIQGGGDSKGGSSDMLFLRILRIFKIGKVFRVIRAIRFVQELRLMFDCVLNSAAQLLWSMLLIVFVLYIFSLIFVQAFAGYISDKAVSLDEELSELQKVKIEEAFGSVAKSMVSLFAATSGGVDWEEQYQIIAKAGIGFAVTYLFFIAFFVIAAWNIVASTFVEKALKLAAPDLDVLILEKRKRDSESAKELAEVISTLMDEDGDGIISLQEFNNHIGEPRVKDFFAVRGLDVNDAHLFFRMLESVEGKHRDAVELETFVGCALRLQGSATSIDLQAMHFDLKIMYERQKEAYNAIEDIVEQVKSLGAGQESLGAGQQSLGRGQQSLGRGQTSIMDATRGNSKTSNGGKLSTIRTVPMKGLGQHYVTV